MSRPIEILLVEDNPGDIRLTKEALKFWKQPTNFNAMENGVEALSFLRKEGEYMSAPTPEIMMLDLNIPKKSGYEVLEEMKQDSVLRLIPVIILTSSNAMKDIEWTYGSHANCYITKPQSLDIFITVMQNIEIFWFEIARTPGRA